MHLISDEERERHTHGHKETIGRGLYCLEGGKLSLLPLLALVWSICEQTCAVEAIRT